ncbi:MAG: TRAP transporter small permease subunit [Oceanospirillales bacterium]|nr:MAG: TRAP transporter small permease subunit [Oceanospirillales bacterium]
MLRKLSAGISWFECWLAAGLAGVLTILILVNVITRALSMPIYWVDELAIFSMVWMTFLATAVVIKRRQTLSVTLIQDLLPTTAKKWLVLFSDSMVLLFAVLLLYFCLLWFEPISLMKAGFEFSAFQMETFNFIYSESTNTLGVKKFWVWLIMPWVALSLMLHASLNLWDSLVDLFTAMRQGTNEC